MLNLWPCALHGFLHRSVWSTGSSTLLPLRCGACSLQPECFGANTWVGNQSINQLHAFSDEVAGASHQLGGERLCLLAGCPAPLAASINCSTVAARCRSTAAAAAPHTCRLCCILRPADVLRRPQRHHIIPQQGLRLALPDVRMRLFNPLPIVTIWVSHLLDLQLQSGSTHGNAHTDRGRRKGMHGVAHSWQRAHSRKQTLNLTQSGARALQALKYG